MSRYLFHLSIPVSDLGTAKEFYVSSLNAEIGRETLEWIDVLLWGHQITLQLYPEQTGSIEEQGKRHFGVVLPWQEWQIFTEQLDRDVQVISGPIVKHEGTDSEQAKIYLKDPSNNIIEIKAYKNFLSVLGTQDAAYDSNAV